MASRPLSQPDSEFARAPASNLVLLRVRKELEADVAMGEEG
jgi:hypothetical protein